MPASFGGRNVEPWRNESISAQTKYRVYGAIVLATLFYNNIDTWAAYKL